MARARRGRTGNTIRPWGHSNPLGVQNPTGSNPAPALGFRIGQKVRMQTGIVGIVVREASGGRVIVRAARQNYACLPETLEAQP